MTMPQNITVTYTDGSATTYVAPLVMMRGHRPLRDGEALLPDWPWTHPTYAFDVPTGSGIASIELDAARQTADVDRSNNRVEFDPKSSACSSAIANHAHACNAHPRPSRLGQMAGVLAGHRPAGHPLAHHPVHHGRRHSHHAAILAVVFLPILLGWRIGVAAVVAYLSSAG